MLLLFFEYQNTKMEMLKDVCGWEQVRVSSESPELMGLEVSSGDDLSVGSRASPCTDRLFSELDRSTIITACV